MYLKRLAIFILCAAVSIHSFAPIALAESVAQETEITTNLVEKEDLIERILEIFPDKFKNFSPDDFVIGQENYNAEIGEGVVAEEVYIIEFTKEVGKGKYVGGYFTFDPDLSLISYEYYSSITDKKSFYPPKVSKEEAQTIALNFLKKANKNETYQIVEREWDFASYNKTLIEPVVYNLEYDRVVNGIPVSGFGGNVEIMGNGEITGFWAEASDRNATFESKVGIMSEEQVIEQMKQNLSLELRYLTDLDFTTGEINVYLAYLPIPQITGILAKSGKWYMNGEFVDQLPKTEPIKKLAEKYEGKKKIISIEEAKKRAEDLLTSHSSIKNFTIEEVEEDISFLSEEIFSIYYSFESGSSMEEGRMEISKYGELLGFWNYHHDEEEYKERTNDNKEPKINYDQALQKAIQYLEKYTPSKLHKLAYPMIKKEYDPYSQSYEFNFPRVENNIPFLYEHVNVKVSAEDGELLLFSNEMIEMTNLPTHDQAMTKEEAEKVFYDKVKLNLTYSSEWKSEKSNQYKLVYKYSIMDLLSFLDAVSGKWKTPQMLPISKNEPEEFPTVKHAWAEKELNLMIKAKILTIEDYEEFNPNESLTKGEALEILMKSLTTFHDDYYFDEEEEYTPSFENVDIDHPLFIFVETAVEMGILDTKQPTFDIDSKLTRQELAEWYVRALQLQEAAKHSDIYYVKFKDANQVDQAYKGHVALASAFGILTGTKGKFNPKGEVTFAQMAVATFRMADTIQTMIIEEESRY